MADVVQAYAGRLFSVEVRRFEDADGRPVQREIIRHPGSVAILPVRDDGRVVLIRNQRIAVGAALWEVPAGTLGAAESPDAAAARELTEETGYAAGRIRRLGGLYTTPGFCDERIVLYLAEDLTAGAQRLEPGEQIDVHLVDAAEVLAMIDDGRIQDGKTIAALLLWDRRRREEGAE